MSDAPVNLNRFRKERERETRKAQADTNAVKFGRTKAERVLEATREAKARRHLDDHQFEE